MRLFFTLLMAVILNMNCHAKKTVVWDNPTALCSLSGNATFKITKMELKTDETVMHLQVKFIPHYWIRFVKESTLRTEDGKEYPIISGEPTGKDETRLIPDSLFWMPESGEAHLALHFQPLPLNTKKVDFIEGNEEGAFRFWNICDMKNMPALPKEWRNIKYEANEVLPKTMLKKGIATIKVRMLDYKPGMNVALHVAGFEQLSENDGLEMEVKLDDNGCAVAEVPVYLTRHASIWLSSMPSAQCLIAPGECVECLVNPYVEGEGRYSFKGYMARTNTDLYKVRCSSGETQVRTVYDLIRQYVVPEELYEALQKCTTPEERFDVLADMIVNKKKAEINKNTNLCDAAKALMRMEAEGWFINWKRNFSYEYMNLLVALNHIKAPETMEEMQGVLSKYGMMLTYEAVKDKFAAMDIEAFSAPYATCSETFWNAYPRFIEADTAEVKLTMFESLFGLRQIIKGHGDNQIYDRYTKHITDPGCLAVIDDYRANQERIMQQLSTQDNIYYNKFDDVAPEKILPMIVERYKGKVVLVDVWQTWCGPCRQGHKLMAPLKEDLKGKNIAFVYLSSPSSPLTKWQKMVSDIPGDHYYLTDKQYSYVMDKVLESNGVPTYAIYDTDGNKTYKQIGFPGAEVIKKELEKQLK